jgi:hypothetical protein
MTTLHRATYIGFLFLSMVGNAMAAVAAPAIEIVDWGLSSPKEVGSEASPDTPTGVNRLVEGPVAIERTTKIPACIGTSFGIIYRIADTGDVGVFPITVVVFHPLIKTPDGRSMQKSSWSDSVTPERRYSGWVFEKSFELVSGAWTISLRDVSGRELASKRFDVTAGACPVS